MPTVFMYSLQAFSRNLPKDIGHNPQADDDDAAGSAPQAKSGFLIAWSM